jgi:hypothetical protein
LPLLPQAVGLSLLHRERWVSSTEGRFDQQIMQYN